MVDFSKITEFDWDKWNEDKNWYKHKVSTIDCEEIFFNIPLFIYPDEKHSQNEERYYVLGRTNIWRLLFISFTIRKSGKTNRIRVVFARDMSRKERTVYESNESK